MAIPLLVSLGDPSSIENPAPGFLIECLLIDEVESGVAQPDISDVLGECCPVSWRLMRLHGLPRKNKA